MNHKRTLRGAGLALALTLALTACGGQEAAQDAASILEQQEQAVSEGTAVVAEKPLVLACGRRFLEQHPCTVSDTGESVVPLIFDGLVSVNSQYQWEGELAESIEREGTSYRITLKEGLRFSDGDDLTAWDVADSLEMALGEGSQWRTSLSSVVDYTVLDRRTLRIDTDRIQPDFENLLTFPIAKEGDDGYIGSGRFFCGERQADTILLEENPEYWGTHSDLGVVELKILPSADALADSLKIGEISCLYDDLASGEAMNLSNRNQAVDINHLVFLGVNGEDGPMEDPTMRRAVSRAVNRQALAERIYASKARPASTIFNPAYYRVKGVSEASSDLTAAQTMIGQAGYEKNSSGVFTRDGEELTLTLLYNSENPYRRESAALLVQQLSLAGIKVEEHGMSYEEYMEQLAAGNFDLYLGELAIGDDMDVRRVFTKGNGYGYGTGDSQALEERYAAYEAGEAVIGDFLRLYDTQMPAIPLLYRQGIVSFAPGVHAVIDPIPSDIFAGLGRK